MRNTPLKAFASPIKQTTSPKVKKENIGVMRNTFEKDYGTADIDIQTGIINYPKENGKTDS